MDCLSSFKRILIYQSHNPIIGRVWKGPLEVIGSNPHPCPSMFTQYWLPRTLSRQLLNSSSGEDSTTSLGNLCQCLVTLTVKVSWCSEGTPVFQCVPVASCPVTGHTKKPLSSRALSHQILPCRPLKRQTSLLRTNVVLDFCSASAS